MVALKIMKKGQGKAIAYWKFLLTRSTLVKHILSLIKQTVQI